MTTDQELKLLRLADTAGIDVVTDTRGVLLIDDLGGWVPSQRRIYIRPGLSWRDRLHTLAHELGHALHAHPAGHHPKYERQAERFAAHVLINPADYAEAEIMFDGHSGAIAQELGVTLALVEFWRSEHERITS